MRKLLSNWLPVAIWVTLIAIESTDMMSGAHTGQVLGLVLSPFFGEISYHRIDLINLLMRKTGHLTGYAILSLLTFRALRGTFEGPVRRWASLAIGFTALVASADEFHQSFIPSRTSSILDVLLDTFGGALMMMLVLFTLRSQHRRKVA